MTILYCHSVERAADTRAATVDTITLDETDRHRRRFAMCSDNGIEFLLELESTTLLRQDDVLRLDDGRGIRVIARAEPLYAVFGRDTRHLLQLAWHVGNRHLATQIVDDHLLIRSDPVIRNMLLELGADVRDVDAGFNPLGGAYESQGESGHDHLHAHPHEHPHEHPR